jgi:hypothetical protein
MENITIAKNKYENKEVIQEFEDLKNLYGSFLRGYDKPRRKLYGKQIYERINEFEEAHPEYSFEISRMRDWENTFK